jgi:rod shape-determining protein MreD
VEHPLIRLVLAYFFYVFHQFFYWVMARALLGQQIEFEARRTLFVGLLNAFVALALFHFLDKLKERT